MVAQYDSCVLNLSVCKICLPTNCQLSLEREVGVLRMHASLKIVNSVAGNKRAALGPDINAPGRAGHSNTADKQIELKIQ